MYDTFHVLFSIVGVLSDSSQRANNMKISGNVTALWEKIWGHESIKHPI